jgi:hypothetical protein
LKFGSIDHFGISIPKLAAVGGAVSCAATLTAWVAVGGVLGQARGVILPVVGALVFYAVVSTPRRLRDRERASQARESVLLSAEAKACLEATGSRSRTLMLLRAREPALALGIGDAGREVLLGARVEDATSETAGKLASYSAAAALGGVAKLRPGLFDSGDEETRGLTISRELNMETKLPIFMTACFFTPIMLLLYAVFSHSYGPGNLAELVALEFIVLDLAFYMSASDAGPR